MSWFTLLAQSVEGGVTALQTIINGGPALILGALVCVLGWVVWKQAERISALEKDFRETSIKLLQAQVEQTAEFKEALTQTNVLMTRVTQILTAMPSDEILRRFVSAIQQSGH